MSLADVERQIFGALGDEDELSTFTTEQLAKLRVIPGKSSSQADCIRFFLISCLLGLRNAQNHECAIAIEQIDIAIIHVGIVLSTFQPQLRTISQTIIDHCTNCLPTPPLTDTPLCIERSAPPGTLKYPVNDSKWLFDELFEQFQLHITSNPEPIVFKGMALDWPAVQKWNSTKYLIDLMAKGYRCVPVETGSKYTDKDWSVEIVPFTTFLEATLAGSPKQYLAQYSLLDQVPELRSDICIPDVCNVYAPDLDYGSDMPYTYTQVPDFMSPITNIWLGPEHTISPLHRDEYHNIYVQIVGYKTFNLYPPKPKKTSRNMYADEANPNTSKVNLADKSPENQSKYPDFDWNSDYLEALLGPGDALFIPFGWWHYVESQTKSIGVNFWF